jgi:CRISPR-associated exonuclease Cas4
MQSQNSNHMYTEDELLPVSALQHLVFCPRQCALIHIEQLWSENLFTAEGRSLHVTTHQAATEDRPGIHIVRGLRLQSLQLGLVGQADVVEFHEDEFGIKLPNIKGLWRAFPVEYKRGRKKVEDCDRVQLCAQAMCLEEMLSNEIQYGAIFYGRPRRRERVKFTRSLRQETQSLAEKLHRLYKTQKIPKAKYQKKCSLSESCMPSITGTKKNIHHYLSKAGIDE